MLLGILTLIIMVFAEENLLKINSMPKKDKKKHLLKTRVILFHQRQRSNFTHQLSYRMKNYHALNLYLN